MKYNFLSIAPVPLAKDMAENIFWKQKVSWGIILYRFTKDYGHTGDNRAMGSFVSKDLEMAFQGVLRLTGSSIIWRQTIDLRI